MKLTVRIPTEILAQCLTEGLGMGEPIIATEPIELEFNMKARELPAYAKAVGEVAQVFEELFTEEPEDGTSPFTVTMDDEAEAA